jgi:hypothetical protein
MAQDTVTVVLSGEVSLDNFAEAIVHWKGLIDSLADEVLRGKPVRWVVSHLEAGSAIATVRGIPQGDAAPDDVERVTRAVLRVGQALESNEPIPFSQRVRTEAQALVSVLNGEIDSIRFETAEADATITSTSWPKAVAAEPAVEPIGWHGTAYGAVEGRVQTLTNRGSLRFTLYDTLHDRAVSCYLVERQQEIMRGSWGKRAVVEGWVTREPATGRPVTVRQVSAVTILPEEDPSAFQQARGALTGTGNTELPEITIRRLRDA